MRFCDAVTFTHATLNFKVVCINVMWFYMCHVPSPSKKLMLLWHPPSLIPFHLSFDLQSTVVVYIWYVPYAECSS